MKYTGDARKCENENCVSWFPDEEGGCVAFENTMDCAERYIVQLADKDEQIAALQAELSTAHAMIDGNVRALTKIEAEVERLKKTEKGLLHNCHDCNAKPGELHVPGCDVERCSVCGGQRLQCNCRRHDPYFARWTGLWPGEAEAKYLGVDLNEFSIEFSSVFFIKPRRDK